MGLLRYVPAIPLSAVLGKTMDGLERRVDDAINRIRFSAGERLPLAALSDTAGLSQYYFHRTFKKAVGETVLEFSNRNRLMFAARLLRHWKDRSILDLALSCGFNSAADFSRVFRSRYGITPRDLARGEYVTLNAARAKRRNRIELIKRRKPGSVREVQVRAVGPLKIIYKRVLQSMDRPEAVKAALTEVHSFAERNHLLDFSSCPLLLGICWDDFDLSPADRFMYDAGIVVRSNVLPKLEPGMGSLQLPGARYAIFDFEGNIGDEEDSLDFIAYSWLAETRYLPTMLPSLEVFLNERSLCDWDRMKLKLFVPIVEKIDFF